MTISPIRWIWSSISLPFTTGPSSEVRPTSLRFRSAARGATIISLTWREDLEALHLACAFDFKANDARLGAIYRLLALINEQLWLGHFDLWKDDGLLLYRHGLLLAGADSHAGQCEALLRAALEACERYYQAFQFVRWAGKTPEEALAALMLETQGHA
jgi:hypothetical protein